VYEAVNAPSDTSDALAAKVQEVYETAQLGYGYMSLATFDDVGLGPTIQIGKINPQVPTQKAIKKLYESTNNGKNILNNIPDHALYVCLPKDYIDRESLVTNSANAKLITWAARSRMGVADGALQMGCTGGGW
jgi:hypothetical protein